MIVFQENINKPTQELTEQVLKDLMQKPENTTLIDSYRQMKRQMAEAEAQQTVEAVVSELKEADDYKAWLAKELKKTSAAGRSGCPTRT